VTLPTNKAKATDASDRVTSKRKVVNLDKVINYLVKYLIPIKNVIGIPGAKDEDVIDAT
jgi:hypothetical protein